jgi:hypothetical protein
MEDFFRKVDPLRDVTFSLRGSPAGAIYQKVSSNLGNSVGGASSRFVIWPDLDHLSGGLGICTIIIGYDSRTLFASCYTTMGWG